MGGQRLAQGIGRSDAVVSWLHGLNVAIYSPELSGLAELSKFVVSRPRNAHALTDCGATFARREAAQLIFQRRHSAGQRCCRCAAVSRGFFQELQRFVMQSDEPVALGHRCIYRQSLLTPA